MSKKLGQEPAFPATTDDMIGTHLSRDHSPEGMSKRFYAACAAMQGILANEQMVDSATTGSLLWVAEAAFKFADQLLKQEETDRF